MPKYRHNYLLRSVWIGIKIRSHTLNAHTWRVYEEFVFRKVFPLFCKHYLNCGVVLRINAASIGYGRMKNAIAADYDTAVAMLADQTVYNNRWI